MTIKRYSEDGEFCFDPSKTDPIMVFQLCWFEKCFARAKELNDVKKAYELGLLTTAASMIWHYRQVEHMNEHGDFNFQLTPRECEENSKMKMMEVELLGHSLTFDDINQMVEEYLDKHFPIKMEVV